eukprot:jgi/Orpsp1_1/1181268/evm.model.c7180000076530.1
MLISSQKKKKEANYYCIPHYISCNIHSEIFEYSSFEGEFAIPLFVAYDLLSSGYKVTINSNGLILEDNIKIGDTAKMEIPLYEFDILRNFSEKQKLYKVYACYLAYKKLEENEDLFDEYKHDLKVSTREDFLKIEKEKIIGYRYDIYNSMIIFNGNIYLKIKNYINYFNKDINIEDFIELAYNLNQSINDVKIFLYKILENDNLMKSKL